MSSTERILNHINLPASKIRVRLRRLNLRKTVSETASQSCSSCTFDSPTASQSYDLLMQLPGTSCDEPKEYETSPQNAACFDDECSRISTCKSSKTFRDIPYKNSPRNHHFIEPPYFHFMTTLFLLFLPTTISALAAIPLGHFDNDPMVLTGSGMIRGVNMKFNGQSLRAFLGVPYAKTPTGGRRFAVSEMVDPWKGEFVANKPARSCPGLIDTMFPQFPGAEMWNPPNQLNEDCLQMNIWVPENHDGTVMVWIFGGGFYSGSPSLDLYDGRVLAVHEQTIVVNINYRLGPFGFLYFGDGTPVPGNMGLMDQQLALRWINENIGHFGGDPRRVTLFGESAGGASAAAHLFAPGSRDLFSRLIAKSSAIVNNWATKPKHMMRDISIQFARRLNCTGDAELEKERVRRGRNGPSFVEQMVQCMSRVPTALLQREADAISESLSLPMTFAFVPIDEDDNFFKGNLFDKLRRRDFKKDVSIMLGTVKDEGTYWLPYYLQKYGFTFNHTVSPEDQFNQALITESDYTKAFDAFLPYFGNSQLVRHALLHAYSRITPDHNHARNVQRWRDGVARFLGDYFFTCALIEFADIVADNVYGAVYMYYFTKRSSANPWPRWMGIMHGYEIEYVFGMPLREPHLYNPADLETERLFSEKVMEFWGRFARTGEPVEFWPKYNRITRKSLVLSDEIARGNSHRIYVDVHGKLCRLLEEAETVARLERRPAGKFGAIGGGTRLAWAEQDGGPKTYFVGPSGSLVSDGTPPRRALSPCILTILALFSFCFSSLFFSNFVSLDSVVIQRHF